jgi:hypothetical protein
MRIATPLTTEDASRGTEAPTIVTLPVRCAPKKAPCPTCGQPGRRKRILPPRRVRTVAYQALAYLEVTCGEYRVGCGCGATFRSAPEGGLPRALYDNKVRDLVLGRIIEDGLSIERTLRSLPREFLLELSTGFVYDTLRDRAAQLDMAEHRRTVLEPFSGTLGVDEVHLGRFTLLLATDPIRDRPVAFALVGANDQDPMRRFRGNLKTWGLMPRVGITDGSNLYPALLAELWPGADHQLCAFHILKEINGLILAAVRRLRTGMARRGRAGRKRKPGRKGAKRRAAAARRGPTLKEKSAFVFKHRHLIVKRREKLTESEREDLWRMFSYLPQLVTLRYFADRIYWLFDAPKDYHQASCRRAALVRDAAFRRVPELARAMEPLSEEKFPRIMAYLNSPVGRRVRTNKHVERANRMIRFLEKVRYKGRRGKTLVRFVALRLDHIWSRAMARGGEARSHGARRRCGKSSPRICQKIT